MKKLIKKILKESEGDWDWVDDVPYLIPGEKYIIRSTNGIYYDDYIYIGTETRVSNNSSYEAHVFKDKKGTGTSYYPQSSIDRMIENGDIRPYEEDWSVKNLVKYVNNLSEIGNRNFYISFVNGITLSETAPIQKELFNLGYSARTKGQKIQTGNDIVVGIESINWDTSMDRYKNISNPNDRDRKEFSFHIDKERGNGFWGRNTNRNLQSDLSVIIDHGGVVIDGHKLLGK